MASKKGSTGKRRASKKKTGLEGIGIHRDHVRAGKLTAVGGLASAPVLQIYDQENTIPLDYLVPRINCEKKVNILAMPWPDRVSNFLRGCGINLTGQGLPDAAHTAKNGAMSGKIIVGGAIVHVIGNTQAVKKLARGLPIRP